MGDVACFSFFANKIITTGEGGMLLIKNKKIYKKAKLLRDHGMTPEKKYYHKVLGFNYRMTSMQAAIGIEQLKKLNSILKKKKQITCRKVFSRFPIRVWNGNIGNSQRLY